jgi:hypothetical protein
LSYPQSHPKYVERCEESDWTIEPAPEALPAKPKDECCKTEVDMVNHPPHYTNGIIEPIDVIESWSLNFALGNVLKYICRCDFKGDRLEQLRKAAWYLNREIERERKLRE